MIADYETTGLTAHEHPLGIMRARLTEQGMVTAADLGRLEHGSRVRVPGLVVARQRPGTAKGVTFLLLEDETGTVNLVVPPPVYERHRVVVRTEPLVVAEGRLERHPAAGGGINVLVDRIAALETPVAGERPLAEVKDFSPLDEAELARIRRDEEEGLALAAGAEGAGDFRAVAPAVMSFASGRRR